MDPSHKISHRLLSGRMRTEGVALLCSLVLLFLSVHESQSFSTGAPVNPALCSSMTPEHQGTPPQTSPSPYSILLEKTEVVGGQTLKITLTSVDRRTPFRGFFVMGQKFKEQKLESAETPLGKFGLGPNPDAKNFSQLVSCGGQAQHAATHTTGQPKNEIVLEWTAPNEDAEFMIVGTFVQSFDKFWVRQSSAKIQVKKDAGFVATPAPVPVIPKLSAATTAKLQEFYSGCTTVKACYGLPSGCVESQDCEMLTTFKVAGSRYEFQVTGQLPEGHTDKGYVASGLSFDAAMGTDSIIGCVLTANADVEVLSFYSEGTSIKRLQNFTAGLDADSLTGQIMDNRVFCEFSRTPELKIEEIQAIFNLDEQDYFVLMASGVGSIPENLHYHTGSEHGFSACPLSLNTNTSSLLPRQVINRDEFYNGCGVKKGCFGFPDYKCVQDKNCELFVSFDSELNFQILGALETATDGYVAAGLSFDESMGSDSVVACVYKSGVVEARSYYNVGHGNNPMPESDSGIVSTKTAVYEEGLVLCEFQRTPTLELPEDLGSFDLITDEYFLLLAKGPMREGEDFALGRHSVRQSSSQSVMLTDTINIGEPSKKDTFYENCGVTKGCFGFPSYACISDKSCEIFVSFDKDFNFQLLGNAPAEGDSYVAVGLSLDEEMAQDSVIACGYQDGLVETRSFYNIRDGKFNLPMTDPNAGIAARTVNAYENGQILCEFQRTPTLESTSEIGIDFDLQSDTYHLLLAKGSLTTDFILSRHDERAASISSLLLSETVIVDQPAHDRFYENCGISKGCFGLPSFTCISQRNCDLFVSFDKDFNFQLFGTAPADSNSYVAVGLSFDGDMGQDSIIACGFSNGAIEARSFYNILDGKDNLPMTDPNVGIAVRGFTGFENGQILCEFQRTPTLESTAELEINFDLQNDKYHLLLAQGSLTEEFTLEYHREKGASLSSISLSDPIIVDGPGDNVLRFYENCGVTKGCFGLPSYTCVYEKNCDLFVSFDKDFNFQLLGNTPANGYIAVGLSLDASMAQDSVIACDYRDETVEARSFYNIPDGKSNLPMTDASAGIAGRGLLAYENGQILCEFQRTPVLESITEIGIDFNLETDKYHLLLAQGLLKADFTLGYHSMKEASPSSFLLSEIINIGEPSIKDTFYENCGVTKGCFGFPSYACISDKSCEVFVSFDKDFNFQLLSNAPAEGDSYVAVGLSLDESMAQDSVIACGYKDGTVETRSFYNVRDGKSNLPMTDPNAGIAARTVNAYENGQILCEFQRTQTMESTSEIGFDFDLLSDTYHLLLAKGPLTTDFTLTQHDERAASTSSLLLSETIIVDQPVNNKDRFYENCGISKGCFGLPSYTCIYDQNCDIFVSFDKDFNFQLLGTASADSSYVAVGLSFDDSMEEDSVIGCGLLDGTIEARSFYNVKDGKDNLPMSDPNAGIELRGFTAHQNGQILCEFKRTPTLESTTELELDFDLQNDRYNLLLAQGPLSADFKLGFHVEKGASIASVLLSETIVVDKPLDPSDTFYDGCGETKGCWGLPSYECIGQRNCDMFTSFDKDFNFQISATAEGTGDRYLALGLSFDKGMDQDSVTGCSYLNGEVDVKSYYNTPTGHNNKLMANSTAGLASIRTKGYENGRIFCEFQRTPLLESPTELVKTFDLVKDSYYLLMAQGPLNSDWTLQYHVTKESSPTSGLLSNIVIIGAPVVYIDEFYGGCGETKSCLGFPDYQCIYTKNCEMFVSFDKDFNFQVIGKQVLAGETYVAVGLSFDDKMGQDSVIACSYDGTDVGVRSYYNVPGNSIPLTNPEAGIVEVTMGGFSNSDIYCEFRRTPTLVSDEMEVDFDLANDKYYLLTATGELKDGNISNHYSNRKVSPVVVELIGTPLIVGAPVSRDDQFYNNCGITKGCFGLPDFRCILERNCEMFVSFDKDFNFQILGKPESAGDRYIAVGLSFDPDMGADSVTGCVMVGGEVQVKSYYNIPDGKNNLKMKNDLDGVATRNTTVYENGKIYCEYTRNPVQDSPDEIEATFNLATDPYYFFLAQGGVREDWALHQHTPTKASSPYPVRLSEPIIIGAELINQFYTGCGETKGCFGMPTPCITYRNCETFVTFDEDFNFELAGKLPEGSTQGHVSVGLSFDNQMGMDLVTGCAFSGESFQIYSYYNVPADKNNVILEDPLDGLLSAEAQFTNGTLYCQFQRSAVLNASASDLEPQFNLTRDEYFILLAKATEVTVGEDEVITALGKHATEDRAASPESVFLNETAVIGESTDFSFDLFYEGCTTVKGCFGLPVGCIEAKNCDMFGSFDKNYQFQIGGKIPEPAGSPIGHVSMGLSFDSQMGGDSIIGCVWQNGGVTAKSYYNIQGGKNNARMTDPLAGLTGSSVGNYMDGYVFCQFSRKEKYEDINNEIGGDIDLLNGKFHILLSRGSSVPAAQPNGEKLGFHVAPTDKGVSAQAVSMDYIGILKARSTILIELHGGFMVVAWLMCASTGMFTARYYKQTHTDYNPLNKAFWFLLHISCMFTTAFMTACGIIFIFIEVGGYSEGLSGPGSWHPILGIILTVLAAMQVLIAFFRPHPGTPNRPYFNWIHWTIGNSAHIVGIACIFLAQKLSKTGLDDNWGYLGVVVGFVIFHVVMHVVMSIHTVWADKQLDIQNKMRAVRPGPMKPSGKSEEAPGTGFRTFMLTLYLVGTAGVSIALVAMVAISV